MGLEPILPQTLPSLGAVPPATSAGFLSEQSSQRSLEIISCLF